MKKIYFAGKFDLSGAGKTLAERLVPDYRSRLLGDSARLALAAEDVRLKDYDILYGGCFYCERASEGDYTSIDCETVVREEMREVFASDIFCAVFGESFSVGSVVELMDAVHRGKRVAVFYKNEKSDYAIKSEYWFAIQRALQIAREKGSEMEVFAYTYDPVEKLDAWLRGIEQEK